jgi:hypothetical protein
VIVRKANSEAEYVSDFDPARVLAQKVAARHAHGTLSDKIAGSDLVSRFWYFPFGRDAFPFDSNSWYVEKYYPYAEGGPLCVDEPIDLEEIELCKKKARHLAECGIRYVYLTKAMTTDEAIAQLREHEKCLGQPH